LRPGADATENRQSRWRVAASAQAAGAAWGLLSGHAGDVAKAGRYREENSLNNNRNNNRRGRGRGNRNQGGGNAANRIDSRARGNAPQLLDKYKKLAQDAQHNGDRVQAEYYLQFADHYFRVIADNKARQDEARAKRQDERGDQDDDEGDDDGEENRRGNRRSRGRRNDGYDDQDGGDDNRRKPNGRSRGRKAEDGEEGPRGDEGHETPAREEKPKRKPRAKKTDSSDGAEIDIAALPPAIGETADEDAPKPKRAPRRRKASDDSEAVEAVG
jgi:hypothetical protein